MRGVPPLERKEVPTSEGKKELLVIFRKSLWQTFKKKLFLDKRF